MSAKAQTNKRIPDKAPSAPTMNYDVYDESGVRPAEIAASATSAVMDKHRKELRSAVNKLTHNA